MDGAEYTRRRTRTLAVSGLAHALRQAVTEQERAQVLDRWQPILRRLDISPDREGQWVLSTDPRSPEKAPFVK